MKRIIIGRGVDCDVVIPDEKDNVSRHHAVISFSFMGKMNISDTSSNGTFINGNRMLKGTTMPITKNDEVRFGDSWVLDWNLIEDSKTSVQKMFFYIAAFVLVVVVGFGIWLIYSSLQKEKITDPVIQEQIMTSTNDVWNADSTNKVAPIEENIDIKNKANSTSKFIDVGKKQKKASKKSTSKKVIRNDVKDKNIELRKENLSSEKNMPIIN